MKSPEDLTTLFRRHGRKITPQRQCIFGVLQGDVTHPTAESVHAAARAKMETISLKTVYQTLNELAALGEIAALDLGTGTIRFDPNVELVHHHLVCRSCGKVRDLHADFSSLTVPPGWAAGFEVGEAEVVFRGLCGGCRTRARSHRRRSSSGAPPERRVSTAPTSRKRISSDDTSSNRNAGEHTSREHTSREHTSRRSTRQKRKG